MPAPFRGVFTIPATPFDEHWQLDEAGLRRVVDFCIECGAHGLVYPVNASQFSILSDEERLRGSRIVVEQCAGRIPVMVGTQGLCTEHAVMFSREAQAMGADAVIAMTPYVAKIADAESIVAYFQGISDAVNIPICVQNHAVGTEMSAALLARLVREVEHVEYIKEEVMPTTHRITEVTALSGPKLKGVFGGAGGRYLLTEYPRGVAGQMPGCHVTDVVVKLWNALERGERAEAKRIFGLMAPLFAIELLCRGAIYKEVLRRRGVIASARSRNAPPDAMDAADHEALDEILADLEPLMTWKGFGSPPPR
ncbi:MAG: dihydrodipicolinate synthase family protein [Chloroflexi bacterium]|nr:dihydrodipicolinate synthase family protein [Chloroflexota bacterium]